MLNATRIPRLDYRLKTVFEQSLAGPLRACNKQHVVYLLLTLSVSLGLLTGKEKPLVAGHQIGLNAYELSATPKLIAGIEDNASGLTYNSNTNTLFAVVNNPETLLELTKDGDLIRRIDLTGFEDTEGVMYLGDERYAVVEERKRTLVIFEINAQTKAVDRTGLKSFQIAITSGKNKGFEGLSYNQENGDLFIINEKKPRQLIKLSGFVESSDISISTPFSLEENPFGGDDYSGVHYDGQTGHLILLSDESHQIIEVNKEGVEISRLDLSKGNAGLNDDVPQAEGITMDKDGDIYVISEPNIFYRLKSKKRLVELASKNI
ncbi:MAG: SdiA-regulated domain-containing protein [Cycloclasticus sp.]|nr:SdiA-regulated domain-containing protein [Cycloclasticus sp.]